MCIGLVKSCLINSEMDKMKASGNNSFRNTLYGNYELAGLTTMQVGGPATYLVRVHNREELVDVMCFVEQEGMPWLVLGKGSNIIFSDQGFRGLIVQLDGDFKIMEGRPGDTIYLGAGVSHAELIPFLLKKGIGGLEFLSGYPGTIGGDIYGNSGTSEVATADTIKAVELLETSTMVYNWYPAEKMGFGYRTSGAGKNLVIGGCFVARQSTKENISRRCKEENLKRKNQPRSSCTSGCIFKNPLQISAGKLIEECGLKGRLVGDMQVSACHANFIVNRGRGTQEELKKLVDIIRKTVYKVKKIELELEVIILDEYGKRWS